jgi:hypothetical protein
MEFSKSVFSYCDYVVILDIEVHGYYMDITMISLGYHKILDALIYCKPNSPIDTT